MALIKPYGKRLGNDLWFHIRQSRIGDVDKADYFFAKKGEFSPESDISFDRHCNRLSILAHSPIFMKMNGKRIKEIRRTEPLWY